VRKLTDNLCAIIITFWVGGLWITSVWAYVLFKTMTDHQMAGEIAGHLFNIMSYIGFYSAVILLAQRLLFNPFKTLKLSYFWVLVMMLFFVLLGHYFIQPTIAEIKQSALPLDVMKSEHAGKFNTWHTIASVVYMVECVLGMILVVSHKRS
jgi:cation transport ATPase